MSPVMSIIPPTTSIIIESDDPKQEVGTPTNKSTTNIVTPSTEDSRVDEEVTLKAKPTRRSLIMPPAEPSTSKEIEDSMPSLEEVSPSSSSSSFTDDESVDEATPAAKVVKNRFFVSKTEVPASIKTVYQIVNKMTGNLGGNGAGGAIYGELTIGSMQKMVNLMKKHTGFSSESRFVDVGCGLGKPNMHVMQDPGVEFSYGIEMEQVRWLLGMHNLNHVLKAAKKDKEIGHKCFLAHGNIKDASSFDPFTHVYMFDIGFPPVLFNELAKMFNRSRSNYLICYHAPRLMIDRYKFKVELITQMSTSMHGSSENHTGYLYKRIKMKEVDDNESPICDPLFQEAWDCTRSGLSGISEYVNKEVTDNIESTVSTRTRSSSRRANKQ